MANVAYSPPIPYKKGTYTELPRIELELINLSPTNEGTYTTTTEQEFILTHLSCFLSSGSTTKKYNELYINNELILKWQVEPLTTGEERYLEKEIVFPNILIRKGTQIKLIASESGGAQGLVCNYSFIGYFI